MRVAFENDSQGALPTPIGICINLREKALTRDSSVFSNAIISEKNNRNQDFLCNCYWQHSIASPRLSFSNAMRTVVVVYRCMDQILL